MKKKLVIALTTALLVTASIPTIVKANEDGYLKNLLKQKNSQITARSTLSGQVDFVNYNEEKNTPVFITGKLSKEKISNEKEASKYLNKNMDAFNLSVGEFEFLTSEKDELGYTHYKFAYKVDGIEVRGSQIILHTNKENDLYAVNGTPEIGLTDKKYSKDFKINDKKAISIATEATGCNDNSKVSASKLLKNIDDNWLSVYEVLIPIGNEGLLITINGTDGSIISKTKTVMGIHSSQVRGIGIDGVERTVNAELNNGIYYLRDITRNGSIEINNTDEGIETLYTSTSPEFNSKEHEAVVDGLYNMGKAYDYFFNEHGRDSYDGKGGDIIVYANLGNSEDINALSSYSLNAFCMLPGLFGFGEGSKIDKTFTVPISETETVDIPVKADVNNFIAQTDVVAHEFTHSVTRTSAGLIYENQSGALNESFSDVFGVIIEDEEGDWDLGENLGYYIIGEEGRRYQRSTKDPEIFDQPAHMKDYKYYTLDKDLGGVHQNSGIPNKAFYNIASKIGLKKAGNLYYRALTKYLVPTSQFVDARTSLEMSAIDLYGEEVKNIVSDSFEAVGITYDGGMKYEPRLSEPSVYIDKLKSDGNFELKIGVNKGNTAKCLKILNAMPGEFIYEEKIDTSEKEYRKSIKFENMPAGIYDYAVFISDSEDFTLEDILSGNVNISAADGITFVGQELPVEALPTIVQWKENNEYKVGQTVMLKDSSYVCRQSHTSQNQWKPDKTPALWLKLPS